ncbi:MAG: hypothetical protein ACRBFS_06580 [Aureispira sp.]
MFFSLKQSGLIFSLTLVLFACQKENTNPGTNPIDGPAAGNPNGNYAIPVGAELEDVSNPTIVIGDGSPESCTGQLVLDAVAQGGIIVFDCGADPITITLSEPAKIFNNAAPDVIIDGGGLVTLSGNNTHRILYMNTCDQDLNWTTNHCNNQDHPRLTVQNLTFIKGNSINETTNTGGGAIWARGGRLKVINCRFFNNVCAATGADVGGGAIRAFSQYNNAPIYIVNSTFGGAEGYGNEGANGGALSSINVSWSIINCLFSHNKAVGNGGNPAQAGTPGGGSGGAIYNDGNTMTLEILGSIIEQNEVIQHGAGIFFVTNDRTGNLVIKSSTIRKNTGGTWYTVYPGISMHTNTSVQVVDSVIEP